MSQDYNNSWWGSLNENFEEKLKSSPGDNNYQAAALVRTITFIWPDGRFKGFNYSYLLSVDYDPQLESIEVTFTSGSISLTGVRLQPLAEQLLNHIVRKVFCIDPRYSELRHDNQYIVTEIQAK